MATPQEQMQTKLGQLGIPAKEIRCFGSQILVTALCVESANKWRMALTKIASSVRGPVQSLDTAPLPRDLPPGYVTRGKTRNVKVWRVGATV